MIESILDRGARPLRPAPKGAGDLAPPRRLDSPARVRELVGKQAAEDERPSVALGVGDVAGRLHEGGEAAVGDGVGVDRESADLDLADRSLTVASDALRTVGSHPEAGVSELHHLEGRDGLGGLEAHPYRS